MKNFALKVIIFVLCVCSIICVTVSFLKPNVMDEIGEQKIWGLVRVREIEEVHEPWDWMLGLETMGALWVDYQEKYLREEVTELSLHFSDDDNDIAIGMEVILSEPDIVVMWLEVDYDCEEKQLIYHPMIIVQGELDNSEVYTDEKSIDECLNRYGLTRKDVQEYQEYALYDVVVKTWAKAHHKSYFLERWKLKRCKVVDNTFQFEEE